MRNPRVRACDLFCGAGGSSTGLLRACQRLGLEVQLVAVNHWKEAIDTHELNHPGVYHLHEDLAAIDPRRALADAGLGTTLDLLWASPECTSFSYSRGGRPISEQSRASAWHPLKWCDQLNVKMFVIENVPAFRSWGPTDRNHRPIKARRGETYRQYLDLFRAMGYTVEARVLNAADYGAAQTRKRLFIIGVKGARPIRWPQPSHAPVGSIAPGLQPWRGAKEIIDWSVRGTSIFNRKKPHARKTLERILIGGEKYWP
ncbi:MAG: DNA cytosine methyltransferase, partial [Tepidiformaceae bacterium]